MEALRAEVTRLRATVAQQGTTFQAQMRAMAETDEQFKAQLQHLSRLLSSDPSAGADDAGRGRRMQGGGGGWA
eukprot:SAG25_NODE_6763_length_531_cov_0.861111_2_plen_72_part_01